MQIEKQKFYDAYRMLNAHGTAVFLYLAGNKDNYQLEISPAAIHNALGMAESTVRDQIKKLIDYRFLIPRNEGSNIYDFYETPQPKPEPEEEECAEEPQAEEPKPESKHFVF